MIWIVLFLAFAGLAVTLLVKLRLNPEVAAEAEAGSGFHGDPSLQPDVNSEAQWSGFHGDPSLQPDVSSEAQWSGFLSEPEASVAQVNTEFEAASASWGYEYEVFLSFRGSDTRHGFTDFLYHALIDAGVRTFRDDESLRTGEEIGSNLLKAIAESKICIPIFSKNYASSKWCLKELTCMLEHKKRGNHMILPVFYDVTPSEVQDQTEYYGNALEKHKAKYGHNIVLQWREALSEVGRFKGMDLFNLANGYQGRLVKLIVSKVVSNLKNTQVIVTDSLIGINGHVEDVNQLLQLGAPDVRIVGLWGMGGIGKTTLSKAIFNQILGDFEGHNFMQDVRETSRRNGLEYLQCSLVSGLSREQHPPFKSVDEGIHMLRDRYREKKVLIVLDDIENTNQLDALVIGHNSFGQGSRIIITTRNKNVLDRADYIYKVEAMNQDHSLELFCKHAFRKGRPTDELFGLSCAISKTTGGLPLALEVIGSLLYGKKKKIWEGTLEKLKMVPNEEVHNKLRVSFETLAHEEKQIFLDIACFFIGEDISKILPMWEDSNFFPEIGIHVLVANSLIKIGEDDNKIWMHDQVRDLGREIVRQENYKQPGKRSRLWHSEDAKDVLTNNKGSSNIEAIRVHNHECCFTSTQFRKLSMLRFLDLTGKVNGDFEKLLPRLQWFKWPFSSFESLINLHLPNLVHLELSHNDLTDEWKGWSSIQMMKLKVLDLSYSKKLRTPNFQAFPNLERLILFCCGALKVIDPSIHKLKNLKYLNISCCHKIKELPPELGSLENLEFLDAHKCSMLTQIPCSLIGRLYLLQTFDLRSCVNLESFYALPNELPNQHVHRYAILSTLNISGCGRVKLLPSLSNLKLLRSLIAADCKRLEGLVGLDQLYALESLIIRGCHSIKKLPDLSKLQKLNELNSRHCYKLQQLEGLGELKVLKKLIISECRGVKELPDLSKLKQLEELDVEGCEKLQEIVGFGELYELRSGNMEFCKDIKLLPDLRMLHRLERLNVSGCEKLKQLVGLGGLEALRVLRISRCKQMEELPDLPKLKQLESLDARGCKKLRLPALDKLENLQSLFIDWCAEIETLPDLSKLRELEYFYD